MASEDGMSQFLAVVTLLFAVWREFVIEFGLIRFSKIYATRSTITQKVAPARYPIAVIITKTENARSFGNVAVAKLADREMAAERTPIARLRKMDSVDPVPSASTRLLKHRDSEGYQLALGGAGSSCDLRQDLPFIHLFSLEPMPVLFLRTRQGQQRDASVPRVGSDLNWRLLNETTVIAVLFCHFCIAKVCSVEKSDVCLFVRVTSTISSGARLNS
ncbi:MAG: hypothetical protein R3B91_10255 [Planctomycetaceae bacterium]